MQRETTRKLREDLSAQERERAERIGDIGNHSGRYENCSWGVAYNFIPSREQH